jgi:hypothetical protein
MKTYALAAMAVILMSGSAMAYPVHSIIRPVPAKSFHAPVLTPSERIQIHRSQYQLNMLERRARADGRVTPWERWQLRLAQNRHHALIYRLTHN